MQVRFAGSVLIVFFVELRRTDAGHGGRLDKTFLRNGRGGPRRRMLWKTVAGVVEDEKQHRRCINTQQQTLVYTSPMDSLNIVGRGTDSARRHRPK